MFFSILIRIVFIPDHVLLRPQATTIYDIDVCVCSKSTVFVTAYVGPSIGDHSLVVFVLTADDHNLWRWRKETSGISCRCSFLMSPTVDFLGSLNVFSILIRIVFVPEYILIWPHAITIYNIDGYVCPKSTVSLTAYVGPSIGDHSLVVVRWQRTTTIYYVDVRRPQVFPAGVHF